MVKEEKGIRRNAVRIMCQETLIPERAAWRGV